jgi:multidrug efflux pump
VVYANDQRARRAEYLPLVLSDRNGAPCGCTTWPSGRLGAGNRNARRGERRPGGADIIYREPNANILETGALAARDLKP